VKLATELFKRATGKTLYLIDEPTTGLSFYDVHKLMDVMQRLVDKGNSILVIEHNLDVIRCGDWVIDLGPEGGDKGGQIVVCGTPEEVAEHPSSHTGRYLKQVLEQHTSSGGSGVGSGYVAEGWLGKWLDIAEMYRIFAGRPIEH
jgi:excinuclease ABC subunit A